MHSDQQRALISVVLLATFTNSAGPDCRRKEACHDADPLTTDIDVPNLAKIYENIMLWSLISTQPPPRLIHLSCAVWPSKWRCACAMPIAG